MKHDWWLPGAVFVVLASAAVVRAFIQGEIPWFLVYATMAAGVAGVVLVVWVRERLRETEGGAVPAGMLDDGC